MPLLNEYVTCGNNSARIKNYYANGLIVLVEIDGSFKVGDVLQGTVSGDTVTLLTGYGVDNVNFKYQESPAYFEPAIGDYTVYTTEPYTDHSGEPKWPAPDLLAMYDNDTTAINGGSGGPWIALDAHFTGNTQTQDYSIDNLIVVR